MKIILERSHFLKALGHAQAIVEKRTTVPILSHVLLEGEGSSLRLSATDLEIALVESIPARVETPGSATVSAHILHSIVRKLPDGVEISLELTSKGSQMVVSAGKSVFTLSCLPPEDFPAIHAKELPYQFAVPAKTLHRMLNRTGFAMSTEETRYYLNGIYFHPYEGVELRAVATDGHRLARMSVPLPQGTPQFPGVILSRKTVNEVQGLLLDSDQDVKIALSETQVSFTFPDVFLTSRLIDGTFPDYERVIPTGNEKRLTLDMEGFSKSVERVSTVAAEKTRGIKVSLKDGKLVLSVASSEIGSAVEEMDVEYAGEPLEIGFNAAYVADLASQMKGGVAEFAMADPATAVVIKDQQDQDALFLLMPMRV